MDTIVRPPETTASIATAPRRRWLRFLIVAIAMILIAALAAGSIWITNYMPLVQGSLGFSAGRADVKMVRVDAFDMRGTVFTVPTGRAASFSYQLSIVNDGPVAVTIDDIATPAGDPLSRRAIRVVPDVWAKGSGPTSEEPWHRFTLPPGHEAIVVMEATYEGRCMGRGDSVSWYQEPLTFSVLGIPRRDILEAGVEVRFTGDGSCGNG